MTITTRHHLIGDRANI